MKHFDDYKTVIATQEKSAGNDSVGNMWTETRSFNKEIPVSEIIEWAKSCGGRLYLTIDENGAKDDSPNF